MKAVGVLVALAFVGFGTSTMAQEWQADGTTCTGAYDALHQRKADLLLMSADARNAVNLDKIDFDSRASDPKLMADVPDYQQGDWEMYSQNFVMMLLKGSIDSDPKPIRTVLDVAARCDAKFGFKPALSLAVVAAPKPPPLAPKAPPALPVVNDKICAVSYLALSYGNQANPVLAQALLQRADGAGGRHLAANPGTNQQAFVGETQAAANARVKAILIDKKAPVEPLFAEVMACDARYGLPPPPER
jgi:hypothetical protein